MSVRSFSARAANKCSTNGSKNFSLRTEEARFWSAARQRSNEVFVDPNAGQFGSLLVALNKVTLALFIKAQHLTNKPSASVVIQIDHVSIGLLRSSYVPACRGQCLERAWPTKPTSPTGPLQSSTPPLGRSGGAVAVARRTGRLGAVFRLGRVLIKQLTALCPLYP